MYKKILFVLLFFIASPAIAGYDEGLAAYNKGDYQSAWQELKPLAENGSVNAQNVLGVMYENGFGVEKNEVQAIRWYRQAAEQNDVHAQYNFGHLLDTSKNYVAALKWFRKAADQGSAAAQFSIGVYYANGWGVEKDEGMAFQWYVASAAQGDNEAQNNLGWMYQNGLGVTRDFEKALQLYELSAKQGYKLAINNLAVLKAKVACYKKSSTLLFGEALNCTNKTALRLATQQAGAKVTREDDGYWYDLYDSAALLEGTSELAIAYIGEKFAKAYYKFDAMVDAHKVVEVRNMVVSKYGKPVTSEGNPSLGPVSYTWKLNDGIRLVVKRDWPDTTVYLEYIHPVNYAAMEAEQARQKRAAEDEKRSKQSKAF